MIQIQSTAKGGVLTRPTKFARLRLLMEDKVDKRIYEICDERSGGGEFFVYLKQGYSLMGTDQHCFGAVNRKEIKETMGIVEPCGCAECDKPWD